VQHDVPRDRQCRVYGGPVDGVHDDRDRAKHRIQLGRQRRLRARCPVSSKCINATPESSSFSSNDLLSIRLLTFPAVTAKQTPAGWSYRQILETVAFRPRGAPHLWHAKVSQLAADLGMPRETTGEEIITFVIQVAKVKNELDQVAPLVRALAGAARLLEGRDVVPHKMRPLVAKLYPGVARRLGFLECAGDADSDLNTAQRGHCDQVSRHVCSSDSPIRMLMGPRIRSHLRPARSDTHQILRQTRTGPRKEKKLRTSPHVNDKGSPRRTYTAVSAPAWSHSKTHTCVRSTAGATSPRFGAAQARAGLRRRRGAGLRATRRSSVTSSFPSSQNVRRQP